MGGPCYVEDDGGDEVGCDCTDNLQDGYPFPFEGQEWISVEAAFQAMKYQSVEKQEKIRLCANSIEAFHESRRRDGSSLRPDWDAIRHLVMYRATRIRYQHHPALAEQLLATGNRSIRHPDGNPFWAKWNALIQLRCREELKAPEERQVELLNGLVKEFEDQSRAECERLSLEQGPVPGEAEFAEVVKTSGSGSAGLFHAWPMHKIEARCAELIDREPPEKGYAVVLTTGAMNPAHRGHAALLHQAAARLEKDGYTVLGAYLSATHDNYVQPKCYRLGTVAFSGVFRAEIAARAVQDDPLVAAAFWEVLQPDFENFPEVAANCQAEFEGKARVFYACGTDHAANCGLTEGMSTEAGWIGVVVVPREGDSPPLEVPEMVWVAEPASGEISSFSSTKVRQALQQRDMKYISNAMSPSAANLLFAPSLADKKTFGEDFEKVDQMIGSSLTDTSATSRSRRSRPMNASQAPSPRRSSPAAEHRRSTTSISNSSSTAKAKSKARVRSRERASASSKRRPPSPLSQFYTGDGVKTAFEILDVNHDGTISREELAEVLMMLDEKQWSTERVACLLRALDADRDGNISYSDFVHWVFSDEAGGSALRLMNDMVPMTDPVCRMRRCQGRRGCQCKTFVCSVCKGRAKTGSSGKCQRCAALEVVELQESRLPRKPRLIVFDLDACLWKPEMFELPSAPMEYDPRVNGVIAGDTVVQLVPGAYPVLRKLVMDLSMSGTQVAVASSTTQGAWANTCLDQLLIDDRGIALGHLVQHREIYHKSKGLHHFPALQDKTHVPFEEMLFFDDCSYGDNCEDVASCCPGVLCVRTPDGLTEELFMKGLEAFAGGATGVL